MEALASDWILILDIYILNCTSKIKKLKNKAIQANDSNVQPHSGFHFILLRVLPESNKNSSNHPSTSSSKMATVKLASGYVRTEEPSISLESHTAADNLLLWPCRACHLLGLAYGKSTKPPPQTLSTTPSKPDIDYSTALTIIKMRKKPVLA